jgi:transcriptional regulator with XRE-family HTH domain
LATRFSSENFEAILTASGKRFEDLAVATGLSFYTFRAYARGDAEPTSRTVGMMADELGCHPGDLFESDEVLA